LVDLDRHLFAQQPAGDLFDVRGRQRPDAPEGVRSIPFVVQKGGTGKILAGIRYAVKRQDALRRQRCVRPQGDHEIETGTALADGLADGLHHHRQRAGPGGIRRENKNSLVLIQTGGRPFPDDAFNVRFRQHRIRAAFTGGHGMLLPRKSILKSPHPPLPKGEPEH